jgi:hypothetical protein
MGVGVNPTLELRFHLRPRPAMAAAVRRRPRPAERGVVDGSAHPAVRLMESDEILTRYVSRAGPRPLRDRQGQAGQSIRMSTAAFVAAAVR